MSHIGATFVSTTTTTTTTTTRSRFAQIMGLPSAEPSSSKSPTKPKDNDEWYIPYNGPMEPPPTRRRPRGNTFGGPDMDTHDEDRRWEKDREDDTFGYGGAGVGRPRASSNAQSYASSSSHSHSNSQSHSHGHVVTKTYFGGGGGGGIGEAPVHSAASTRDRASTYSARALSTYSARDRASMLSTDWDREREHRGSIASFLTFGQGSRRPNVSVNTARNAPTSYAFSPVSPNAPGSQLSPGSTPQVHLFSPTSERRSEESSPVFIFPARGRRSEEGASRSHAHTPFHPHPQSQVQRKGTIDARDRGGRPSVDGSGRPSLEGRGRSTVVGRGKASDEGHGWSSGEGRARRSFDESGPTPGSASTGLGESSLGHQDYGVGGADLRGRRDATTWYQEDADLSDTEEINPMQRFNQPSHPLPHTQLRKLSHSASQPVFPSTNAFVPQQKIHTQPHPYAVAFPSTHQPSQSPSHVAMRSQPAAEVSTHFNPTASTAATHLHPYSQSHSNFHVQAHAQAHAQAHTRPTATSPSAVSPAAIAAALNASSRRGFGTHSRELKPSRSRSLKASISTPNLRTLFGMGNGGDRSGRTAGEKGTSPAGKGVKRAGEKPGSNSAKTQYAAETWCDALMFPRPRFRAHFISPPSSPTDNIARGEKRNTNMWAIPREVDQATMPTLTRAVTVNVRPPSPHAKSLTLPPRTPPRQNYLSTDPHPSPRPQRVFTLPKDNLALNLPKDLQEPLTPAEEVLLRVVAEGERRDQEREKWNEVARSSFQNRRSRSLSRTRSRKKSGTAVGERDRVVVRIRVESDAGMVRPRASEEKAQGLTRSLSVGLTTLAAEAFRQPTPTISTGSHGGTESNAHSRSTSESMGHRRGHSRNTSWGKVALKKLCAPEEDVFSDAAISPQEEKQEKLEGALMHQNTAKIRVRGRREEAEEADVQFMDIAPLPPASEQKQNVPRSKLDVEDGSGRSHSQNSNVSDSLDVPAVGIALSTPPNPSPVDQELPDLSTHPYAQPSAPRTRAEPVPVSAAYAGPHPTSHDYNRHRLPPHALPDIKPPEKRMYAALQSGVIRQVSTPEIVQSPVTLERSSGTHAYATAVSPSAYAYSNVSANDKRESTLGVEEVLMSRAFQRGGGGSAEDSGFGSVDDHDVQYSPPRREPSPPPPQATPRVRRKPVALNPYSGIPSLSHTVTTAAHTDVPEPELVHHIVREVSIALSSPSSQDSGSSRMSPRPLGSMDDLEPFRDLFYKPGRAGSESAHRRTPSLESRRILGVRDASASWGDDRIKSTEGLNGLRNLTRQLSDESQSFPNESQRLDRLQEERLDGHSPSLPGLNDESLQIGTPLRSEYEEGQDFPEDIQSSRASSIIEHESIEETLRLGTVSLLVPEHTEQTEQRQSTALSFGDTEDGGSMRPNRDTIFTTTSSQGIPGNVDDLLRTSFVTTTSSTSHMSNIIGDFPTPPVAEGMTLPAIASQSYFADSRPSGSRLRQSSFDHAG